MLPVYGRRAHKGLLADETSTHTTETKWGTNTSGNTIVHQHHLRGAQLWKKDTRNRNSNKQTSNRKQSGVLKLTAGKLEITRNPFSDSNAKRDSQDSDDSSSSEDQRNSDSDNEKHYSSLSAKTPTPNQGAKRKQKETKQKRRRTRSSRNSYR